MDMEDEIKKLMLKELKEINKRQKENDNAETFGAIMAIIIVGYYVFYVLNFSLKDFGF